MFMWKKESHVSLLNQKLEMIKLSENTMSKAKEDWNLGQVVKVPEKFLKEIKSAASVNTWIVRKPNILIADMGKALVIYVEDQTSHNLSLSQSLIQRKVLTLFSSLKAERGEDAAEEKFELAEIGSWGLGKNPFP